MAIIESDFSAKEPSLGYFYQIKYALLTLLLNSKELQDPIVRIENLDDIEIEEKESLTLFQTKLHIKSKANLTDSSVDFWKSIRVWSEHISNGFINLDETSFFLITTEKISELSNLSILRNNNNTDEEYKDLVNCLDQICLDSKNKSNEKAYASFRSLSSSSKLSLLKRIVIFDNSIDISNIDYKIKKQLIHSSYPEHLDAFCEILNGWWFKKCIDNLTNKIESISSMELQIKIANIRDSFQADNLPNHFPDQLEITDDDIELLRGKKFIKQLELVQLSVNSKTVRRAISDFRRAFEQRSKWLRLQLLNPDEEAAYDKRLQDHWQNIFDIMTDDAMKKSSTEQELMGKEFYIQQFAKSCPQIKIREKFNEDYLTRGSYHILSDSKRIGWHPNFEINL